MKVDSAFLQYAKSDIFGLKVLATKILRTRDQKSIDQFFIERFIDRK